MTLFKPYIALVISKISATDTFDFAVTQKFGQVLV